METDSGIFILKKKKVLFLVFHIFRSNYEGRLKSPQANQDTLMECDKMRFILQHRPPCGCPHTSVGVVMLGSHWSKKSSTADMTSSYEIFNSPSYSAFFFFFLFKQIT